MDFDQESELTADDEPIDITTSLGPPGQPVPPWPEKDNDKEPAHEDGDDHSNEGRHGFHFAYPGYHSYDRSGNGYTKGDRHPWIFYAKTDSDGFGTRVIRFPERATQNPYVPGLENYAVINGWTVWIAFMDPAFGFDKFKAPVSSRTFEVAEYQRTYWRLSYRGPPNETTLMSVMRLVNFADEPPIRHDVPVSDKPTHGDL